MSSSTWTLHLVNARGQLGPCADVVRAAVAEAEGRMAAVAPPLALDITAYAARGLPEGLIVMGHAYEPGVIGLQIDVTQAPERLRLDLLKTLYHELHHALRWDGPGYGETLGGALASEGLAQCFLHEMMDTAPEPFEDAVPDSVCEAWRPVALAGFDDADYDHDAWFFGTGEMPPWLGYTLARRMVGRYLTLHPQATALSLAHADAEVFRAMLGEPL